MSAADNHGVRMTVREQVRYWGVGTAIFVGLLWLLADALLPFVLGAAIAYLTDPLADWLEEHGLSRVLATVVITVCSIGTVTIGILLVVPLLVGQIEQVIDQTPRYLDELRLLGAQWLPEIEEQGSFLNRALANLRENAQSWSVGLLQRIGSFGIAVINLAAVLLVTPVVAFYLLMDWDHMVEGIDDYLPREHRDEIRFIARELDNVLAGFVRGQLTVCMILGSFYAIGLMVVGLNFGLLIGVFAGLISFIPFVGSILGGLLSVGVAAAQFWDDPVWIVVVAVIFVIGQAVEGNFLTPKLVGDKVGLHPVWLMFALSAFGVVFGFVGLLVAVPAAAAIGVIGRYMANQYKGGRLYQGGTEWRRAMRRKIQRARDLPDE
ncbi:MAG: AI-2E family transporter [Pseudomonadota bacterium]